MYVPVGDITDFLDGDDSYGEMAQRFAAGDRYKDAYLASGIADADELLISDAGTIKRTDMSVIKTYIGAADDATALAIAIG